MKQRFCEIELYNSKTGNKKVYRDLAITFDIEVLAASGNFAHGTITVAGLSTETINEFTMFMPNFLAEGYWKRVRLTVGYIDDDTNKTVNSSTIFDGFITRALPSALPERVFVIEVMEILNTSFSSVILSYKDIDLYNLVANVAIAFGIAENEVDKRVVDLSGNAKNKKIDSYYQNGNLQQHLLKIKGLFYKSDGYRVWYRNGNFYIGNFSGKVDNAIDNDKIRIGGENGLLIYDMIAPDVRGINVATEIVDTLQLYKKIYVKSKQIPSGNGTYTILKLRYVGATRDTVWKCIVEGINPDREIDKAL